MSKDLKNMNGFNIFQAFRNPEPLMRDIIANRQFEGNAMAKNVANLALDGKTNEAIEIGRNYAKEKGIDFDKEFEKFKKQFGM